MKGYEQQLAKDIEAGRYDAAARTCRRASARLAIDALEPLAVVVESSFKREWLSDVCLVAQQHRVCCDKAPSKAGKSWDPERALSAVLCAPLAATALREHRYVAAAAMVFSKIPRESRVARDVLQLISYGRRAPGYRRYRRQIRASTLALADRVAKAGTCDRLSIDVLQRALNLGGGQESLAALLEALVQRRESNIAAEVFHRVPPAQCVGPVLAPATRAHLAIGVLDGSLNRLAKARLTDELSAKESTLERLMSTEHFRLLSAALLDEVRRCLSEDDLFGLVALEKRITAVSQWDFTELGRHVHLRTKFLSAFLADRVGAKLDAKNRYEEFLRERLEIEEPSLGRLARNNLAVLRLKDGDLAGLSGLVFAALGDQLPGACFSLYNVVQITRKAGIFSTLIEPLIRTALSELPEDQRNQWLLFQAGAPTGEHNDAEADEEGRNSEGADTDEAGVATRPILDLKKLLFHLAGEVRYIDHHARTGDGFELWMRPEHGLIASPQSPGMFARPRERHAAYAEAVSILYACDFPDRFPSKRRPPASTPLFLRQLQGPGSRGWRICISSSWKTCREFTSTALPPPRRSWCALSPSCRRWRFPCRRSPASSRGRN